MMMNAGTEKRSLARSPVVMAALLVLALGHAAPAHAQSVGPKASATVLESPDGESRQAVDADSGKFVANGANIGVVLNALSGRMHRPMVPSARVRGKQVTGRFDLGHPQALLRKLSDDMSLLIYDDGSTIYVYDNSEIKNVVISMQHATVRSLREFIRETHLLDPRFPVRGDDLGGTFYVTGAPVYVNLVTAAARYLDQMHTRQDRETQVVKTVRLQNTFVQDRSYTLRDQTVDIPGMATVMGQVFGQVPSSGPRRKGASAVPGSASALPAANQSMPFSLMGALPSAGKNNATGSADSDANGDAKSDAAAPAEPAGGVVVPAADGVRAVAYPDTNSIILVGPYEKVQDMAALVHSLDVEKRQVELSLWVIDIQKTSLDQLGVNWQGSFKAGGVGVSLNTPDGGGNFTTLNGVKFLASIKALSDSGDATVVSRPVLLTQENVSATFDTNQTFYVPLIGERTSSLDHVTYGTMINVLPRLTNDAGQVEMIVNIEDGDAPGARADVDTSSSLPLVHRTEINTVARVPREMSLLIGGYTRDEAASGEQSVPGLSRIPLIGGLFRSRAQTHNQVVRIFLIQPKLLRSGAAWQDGQDFPPGNPDGNETLRSTVQMLKQYVEIAP